jgi:hypothetical protein
VVRRAFANSLLSLLMLATLVWGGCISCDEYFMWPGAKSCCSPNGHCKTKKTPTKQAPRRECTQIAFDHHKTIDHHIALPVVGAVEMVVPFRSVESVERWQLVSLVEPSPPDLQVLHSTFLI